MLAPCILWVCVAVSDAINQPMQQQLQPCLLAVTTAVIKTRSRLETLVTAGLQTLLLPHMLTAAPP